MPKPLISEATNMNCPLDNIRCYIKDPYVEGTICRREEPNKCRHGEFWEKCKAYPLFPKIR
jgi:hypothetical protein